MNGGSPVDHVLRALAALARVPADTPNAQANRVTVEWHLGLAVNALAAQGYPVPPAAPARPPAARRRPAQAPAGVAHG